MSFPPRATSARTRIARLLAAVFAAVLLVFAPAVSATAHSGPWELIVAPDGAGGLTAFGKYIEDGHVVTEIIDPVATAVSADGETVGPVSLVSSAEGEGIWVTSAPFLTEGDWTVTVSTTTPETVTATLATQVAPLTPPQDASTGGPSDADGSGANAPDSEAGDAASAADDAMPILAWVIGAVVLAAVAVALVIVLRRRARPAQDSRA